MKTQIWLAFIFGVVFLLIALAFALVAFYLPKPANPGIVENFLNVMQVVLAISAAGVAAVIPGFLSVSIQTKLGKNGTSAIRAGGALAVFVVIYLIGPKSLALDKLNQRVTYNERLDQCMSFVPAFGSPMTGALKNCLEVARLDPARWEAHRQIGRIQFWNAKYGEAIGSYKTSISLRVGTNFDDIKRRDQIRQEVQTDFSYMSWSIAMAHVGLANSILVAEKDKLAAYETSMAVGEMSRWFVEQADHTSDLLNELTYLRAMGRAYIWLTKRSAPTSEDFVIAVSEFKKFLTMPNIVPQWAEYHLACLHVVAASNPEHASHVQEARAFLAKALRHLLRNQNDKAVIQRLMMKCRLRDPEDCEPPRGTEPMVCSEVFNMFKDDTEISRLVQNL